MATLSCASPGTGRAETATQAWGLGIKWGFSSATPRPPASPYCQRRSVTCIPASDSTKGRGCVRPSWAPRGHPKANSRRAGCQRRSGECSVFSDLPPKAGSSSQVGEGRERSREAVSLQAQGPSARSGKPSMAARTCSHVLGLGLPQPANATQDCHYSCGCCVPTAPTTCSCGSCSKPMGGLQKSEGISKNELAANHLPDNFALIENSPRGPAGGRPPSEFVFLFID